MPSIIAPKAIATTVERVAVRLDAHGAAGVESQSDARRAARVHGRDRGLVERHGRCSRARAARSASRSGARAVELAVEPALGQPVRQPVDAVLHGRRCSRTAAPAGAARARPWGRRSAGSPLPPSLNTGRVLVPVSLLRRFTFPLRLVGARLGAGGERLAARRARRRRRRGACSPPCSAGRLVMQDRSLALATAQLAPGDRQVQVGVERRHGRRSRASTGSSRRASSADRAAPRRRRCSSARRRSSGRLVNLRAADDLGRWVDARLGPAADAVRARALRGAAPAGRGADPVDEGAAPDRGRPRER